MRSLFSLVVASLGMSVTYAEPEKATARLWDIATGREIQSMEGHRNTLSQAAFLPKGDQAITSSFDQILCVCKLRP